MPKAATGRGKNAKPVAEPRLGIFWLVNGKLLIDSAPLSKCEQYGDHHNYPGSHIDVWERWRRIANVPPETEYEERSPSTLPCSPTSAYSSTKT
ncbi:MAG: hypothetical protein DMG97_19535 [Acidobacteria bacterium]|nr:MAG: hypothetical protein DMG97_19535 [Acidobacteriota bacterium]